MSSLNLSKSTTNLRLPSLQLDARSSSAGGGGGSSGGGSTSAGSALLDSPRWLCARLKIARACVYASRGDLLSKSDGLLGPTEFRNTLRRVGVELDPRELGALFVAFDRNGDGTVEAAEFLRTLYEIGSCERRLREREHASRFAAYKLGEDARNERERAKRTAMSEVKLPASHTVEERTAALAKIQRVAATWEPNRGASLAPFTRGGPLTPSELRSELRALLNVRLTPGELAALVEEMDASGDGLVDGAEFVSRFFALAGEMRSRKVEEERRLSEKRETHCAERARAASERFAKLTEAEVAESYTAEDELSALAKIAKVARGDLDGAAGPELRPFKQSSGLDATALRHFLRVCLRVTLTPAELAAMIGLFDASGDGKVDGAEFLNCFYKLVRRERDAARRDLDNAAHKKREKERLLQEKHRQQAQRHTQATVVWPTKVETTTSRQPQISDDIAEFLDNIDAEWAQAGRRRRKTKKQSQARQKNGT